MEVAKKRYTVLDMLRGAAILCMVVYHMLWDMVYMFDMRMGWFRSEEMRVFQLGIRWTFILISGFCWSLGRHRLKRALIVLLCSMLISAVTVILMPDGGIMFGVLSLIGTGMLITIPLEKVFRKISPYIGLFLCAVLFAVTLYVPNRVLGIQGVASLRLPDELYADFFTAYLGFPPKAFYSTDYVPVIPWLFLFWVGHFLYLAFERKNILKNLSAVSFKPLEWLGRHSLVIYMLHQPIIYAVLYLTFEIIAAI